MNKELQALEDADFGWVQSLESVWSNDEGADAGPNQEMVDDLIARVSKLTKTPDPPARVFLGQAGIGKTHLVGVLRRRAWAEGCWFVMLDVVGITDFWKSAALSFVTSLLQEMPDGQRQYQSVIAGIARRFKIEKEVNIAFASPTIEPKKLVDLLVGGLMKTDMANALQHQDVFRALALLRSHDLATVGIAHAWLQGYDAEEGMRKSLGFLSPPPSPVQIVRGLLWVMSLAGPTLIAVDQIDGVINAKSNTDSDFSDTSDFTAMLSSGLLDLSRTTGRGMLVMTCLLSSWDLIKSKGPSSLTQSFDMAIPLRPAQTETFVRKLITDRLVPSYTKLGMLPESPTGPFTDAAILSAQGMTPRTILMRCDEHRKRCLAIGELVPCHDLVRVGRSGPHVDGGKGDGFDSDFESRSSLADLAGLLDDKDDGKLGVLLRDTFDLYAKQIQPKDEYDVVSQSDPVQRTPPLHGRLTFIDHGANDRDRHFCFRALQHSNAVALCARFRAALTASGISAKVAGRKLIIVRRGMPPSGPKTKELFDAFRAAGGLEIDPSDADLRSLVALREMRDAAISTGTFDPFASWLVERKPLCETDFFRSVGLCPPPLPPWDDPPEGGHGGIAKLGSTHREDEPQHRVPSSDTSKQSKSTPPDTRPAVSPTIIPLGPRLQGGGLGPVDSLAIDNLTRHTGIFAGSGSGKTVLLRRIVEEAALAGVPSIVLDTNNDLARLGTPWPERPEAFSAEDSEKAGRYARDVEVVVWTPGVAAGRPLTLAVLPDFSAVTEDDGRAQAVDMAWATLVPLVGASGAAKVPKEGLLKEALAAFAREGRTGIDAFIEYLADLPDGVSKQTRAQRYGVDMSDQLRGKIAVNPLLNAAGQPLDPAALFTAARSGATRISVINFAGLDAEASRQDFVNQLQMALFTYIKRHPSATPRLYVCDEAQNFAPSTSSTASKASALALVRQGRKFGLGMIFATQAPKGIDTNIVSNCVTHFYGRMSSPALIDATEEMMAARGRPAKDLGSLTAGTFYFSTEGTPAPVKLKTPLCLSYHPKTPATPDEVVALAQR